MIYLECLYCSIASNCKQISHTFTIIWSIFCTGNSIASHLVVWGILLFSLEAIHVNMSPLSVYLSSHGTSLVEPIYYLLHSIQPCNIGNVGNISYTTTPANRRIAKLQSCKPHLLWLKMCIVGVSSLTHRNVTWFSLLLVQLLNVIHNNNYDERQVT